MANPHNQQCGKRGVLPSLLKKAVNGSHKQEPKSTGTKVNASRKVKNRLVELPLGSTLEKFILKLRRTGTTKKVKAANRWTFEAASPEQYTPSMNLTKLGAIMGSGGMV